MLPKLYIPTPLEYKLEPILKDIKKLTEEDNCSVFEIISNDLMQYPIYYFDGLDDIPYMIEFDIYSKLLNNDFKYKGNLIEDSAYFYNERYGKPFEGVDGDSIQYIKLAYDIYKTDKLLKSL